MWLALALVVLITQRVAELTKSARNVPRLRTRGAREYGAAHFPWMVAVHTLFPILLAVEVWGLGSRPGRLWPLWLALWAGAIALHWMTVRALGDRWTVRVWVIPGVDLVRSGPYHWLRHPAYVAVTVELAALPLAFGAWRTAVVIGGLNALILGVRIRAEEKALRSTIPGPT